MYSIILLPEARKFYKRLYTYDRELFDRIDKALDSLKSNPLLGKPLKDRLKGKYSLRVGIYRIIYSIQKKELIIYVLDIGHRRKIYRSL